MCGQIPKHKALQLLRGLKLEVVPSKSMPKGHAKIVTKENLLSQEVYSKRMAEMSKDYGLRRMECLAAMGTILGAANTGKRTVENLRGIYETAMFLSREDHIPPMEAFKTVVLRKLQGKDVFEDVKALSMKRTHFYLSNARVNLEKKVKKTAVKVGGCGSDKSDKGDSTPGSDSGSDSGSSSGKSNKGSSTSGSDSGFGKSDKGNSTSGSDSENINTKVSESGNVDNGETDYHKVDGGGSDSGKADIGSGDNDKGSNGSNGSNGNNGGGNGNGSNGINGGGNGNGSSTLDWLWETARQIFGF